LREIKFQRYPRKTRKLKSLGGFFQSFLPSSFPKKKSPLSYAPKKKQEFEFVDLHFNWKKIVGGKLNEFTRPQKIQRSVLFIMTKHSQYAHHLIHMEEPIKDKIFSAYPSLKGKIKKLRFMQNEAFFKEDKTFKPENMTSERQYLNKDHKYHPQSPAVKKLKAEAENIFSDIEDQEVKNSLIKLFIQNKI